MKKKLLEKDGFYLALFVCVCLVAIGGVWFTKNNVDELTSNDLLVRDMLRKSGKKVICAINKVDNKKGKYFFFSRKRTQKNRKKLKKALDR